MGALTQIIGGITQGSAAKSAAGAQVAADQQAIAQQKSQYQATTNNLQPYVNAGSQNLTAFSNQPAATSAALNTAYNNAQNVSDPTTMTQAQLEASPGYQFQLQQGTAATQASAAARGLGVSGAALKGAANYASGLSGTYQQQYFNQNQAKYADASQQFSNQNAAQNTNFNQLQGTVNTGLTAGNYLGNYGQQSANAISSAYGNIGVAQATGINSQAANNAGALQGVGNLLGGNLLGGSSGGGGLFNSLLGGSQNYIDNGTF